MILRPLPKDVMRRLKEVIPPYLDGECYEFAAALHALTGWPMIGIRSEEYPIRHAVVRDPEGRFWDIRGPVGEKALGRPFGLRPPYGLREVTLADLRAVRPVFDESIHVAAQFAEVLFPDLPCLPDSRRERAKKFAEELEKLSRRYGFWIRSAVPAEHVWPKLAAHEGDEEGYALRPTHDGLAFSLNRVIKGDAP